ncbi:MAG: TonB-dependent receptor [Pseudomonadota bacterium]
MKIRKILNGAVAGSVSAAALTVAAPNAIAQSDEGARTLDVVVVEAQRREQNLNEVPISITTFDAEEINAYNIVDIQDYAQLVPNLGFTSDGSPLFPAVNIRGVENIGGIVNSIGIYVDEINTTPSLDVFAFDANLFDIERIEVLRGPQGTLFGRNVLGGVINVSTVKPGNEFGGRIDGRYGSFDTRRVKASLNVPITDRVFTRGTVYYEETDGWINNVGPSGETNDDMTWGARIALRAELTPNTLLDIAGSYSDLETGLPDAIPDGQTADFFRFIFNIPADPLGEYAGIGFYPENDDTVNTNGGFFRDRQTTVLNARLEHDFGSVVGIFNAGYIENERSEDIDADYSPSDFFQDIETGGVEALSFEGRLQSNNDSRLSWVAGAAYSNDERFFTNKEVVFPDLQLFTLGFVVAPELVTADERFESEIESWGVFADLTYQLDQDGRWTVSVGGRYSDDTVTDTLIDGPSINNGFSVVPPFGPNEESFKSFTARGSLVYAVTDDVNLYGAISRGTKPGGFNVRAVQDPDVPSTYDIETLLNYEIGAKGFLFDNRMSFSLSAFYMDWEDLQFETVFFAPGSISADFVTLNAGVASSYGVEADFSALVTDNLTINGGFGYLKAEIGEGDDVADSVDPAGNTFSIDGNSLPRSPEFSFNLAAEYSKPITNDFDSFFRVEGNYRTEQFESVSNGESSFSEAGGALQPDLLDGYGILNVRMGVRNDALSLTVFGENLLDETEVVGIRDQITIVGFNQSLVRRQFGIRATYDF